MKKFNYLIIGCAVVYLVLAALLFIGSDAIRGENTDKFAYKVEIHQVMRELEDLDSPKEQEIIDLSKSAAGVFDVKSSGYTYLRKITYLSSEDAKDVSKLEEFYKNQNGVNTSVQPLVTENGMGYVRFDYVTNQENTKQLWFMESILFAAFMGILAILLFIRIRILKPFHTISEMPYELSKGHLKGELEESKSRFLGRFIWGISMLRDTLNDSKSQELKLLKEKKLLLLSISHDIKIPLSTIRLYAKAIKEDIYDTKEKRQYAAGQIEVHTKEIEDFVKEIMNASSEDLIHIEVNNADFYLKDYVEKIRQTYDTKMKVNLIDFRIEAYENCLLKGDFDRAVEGMENLLENAMKYGDGKAVTIDFYEEDYCQVIRVFNTGEPIATIELPHIFDSFYRGSNVADKTGNGLGLYIARQMMHKMGGEIFAEISEGGMNFCLVFQR